eukprot:scaffold60464_cov38-Prasinocladus_malaysianus.AAC.3
MECGQQIMPAIRLGGIAAILFRSQCCCGCSAEQLTRIDQTRKGVRVALSSQPTASLKETHACKHVMGVKHNKHITRTASDGDAVRSCGHRAQCSSGKQVSQQPQRQLIPGLRRD